MKILVADKISAKGVAFLRQQPGFEVVEAYGSSPEKILSLVKDVHAIAVRSETKITREVIAAAPLLKVVGRAGVGVDNVDVEAATERGVVVMNTPSGNTIATAELTFTHMLCGARPVPQAAASMASGKWDRKSFSGVELFRKTLGIVGLVLNILGILTSIILVAITVVAYNGIQARAQTSQDHATANSVASHAEAYYVIEEPVQYPSDLAAFEKYTDTSLSELPSDSVAVQDGTDPTPGVVTYKRCNPESAWVSYYDRSISQAVVIPLGNATSLTVC